MTAGRDTGTLLIIESGAALRGPLAKLGLASGAMVLERTEEPMHALLERVEQSAQGVRKLGRDLRQAVILLGDTDPDQIARRVDLIHGVSRSLEHAGTLLLVPTRTDAHERSRLLQLFGWVVAELQRGLSIRLLLPHSPEALGVAAAQAVAAGHVALPLPAVA